MKTPPKQKAAKDGMNGGWDLSEVGTDFLTGELIRRGYRTSLQPPAPPKEDKAAVQPKKGKK